MHNCLVSQHAVPCFFLNATCDQYSHGLEETILFGDENGTAPLSAAGIRWKSPTFISVTTQFRPRQFSGSHMDE